MWLTRRKTVAPLLAFVAAALVAPAFVARRARADAPGVKVDLAARTVRLGAASAPIALAADDLPEAREVHTAVVPLGGGREVTHVRVPSKTHPGVAWEALLADGSVVFAGVTGYARGEEGERTGQAIEIAPGEGGAQHVLVGDIREDLRICGQAQTLLTPRGLDPQTMTLRGASVQRLSRAQRDGAVRVVASAHGGPADAPLAPLLTAVGASTAIGAAAAVTDRDPATTWSEARPGDGHGEFVTMRGAAEVPIPRLAIAISPKEQRAEGAAPRSFFLVTDTQTIAVTLPEDAWMHPGVAYDVPLVEPLRASCVSLVLDEAYAQGKARPDVTVAELFAYSAFDGPSASLDAVAAALSGGGARADAAAAVLKRAGAAGLAATAAAYDKLDDAGHALAMDVAASAPGCDASAPLLLKALGDRSREVARKGRGKLERCGKNAAPALAAAVKGSDMAARAHAAPLLASVAPSAAIDPLAEAMGQGGPEARAAVRGAFAHAAHAASKEKLAALIGDGARPVDARIDLLRALGEGGEGIGAIGPQAEAAIDALLRAEPTLRTRYLLAGPLAELARAGSAPALERLVAMIAHDPDAPVRAHAAEVARGIAAAEGALVTAIGDPEPRVREAALRGLAGARRKDAVPAIAARLAKDEWTFVRSAAAAALAALPASPEVVAGLGAALEDKSGRVREAALVALAAHRAAAFAPAVRARMEDEREALDVRVTATQALGVLCDRGAIDALTKRARAAAPPLSSEAEMQVGLAAADALGKLHPSDLAARLAPLREKTARAEAQRAAEHALAAPPQCR